MDLYHEIIKTPSRCGPQIKKSYNDLILLKILLKEYEFRI